MNRGLIFFLIIAIIIIGILGYKILTKKGEAYFTKKETPSKKSFMPEEPTTTENKKVALIIAFRDFRDEEYSIPKGVLEQAGIKVSTISNNLGTAIGSGGEEAFVDISIENLNVKDFDGIVFIGGQGALSHLDNEKSYNIARQAVAQNKVLGAICISPVILAKSGVLQEKRATVWSSPLNKSATKTLNENGAIYDEQRVVVDGRIVTGNGPPAAQEFGQKLVEVLKINN